MKRIILSLAVCILAVAVLNGQDPEKKKYKATRVPAAPVINGLLDEDFWETEGEWVDDFVQHEPYNGAKASQKTDFKILFDDDNLYVAVKAFDTAPDSIVNRLTRRDQADGDLVAIILDSYHDLRTAFCFGVSSAGVKYDLMFTNDGQNEDETWDPNWWVKTSINKEGWVAEMKIPLSQVRFEKNSADVWGLELARVLYRKNETCFWQHIPKEAPGLVHLFGEISGLEEIEPRKIFDITPYGVAKAETFEAEPDNPFRADGRSFNLNAGLDAKIGVTNNMTMDLTINPDFGQVEADPSEVNLSAYETFFEEKRPFFIEGNNITNFGLGIGDGGVGNDNLFYSRRIGRRPEGYPDLEDDWHADVPTITNIIGAAKLTGKTQKGLSVGFIEALAAEEKAEIDTVGGTKYETVEPLTNYMVGRVQRDINEGNTIVGGIFTGTNRFLDDNLSRYMHKSAYSGGIDFTQYFKDKNWMFNLNTAFSYVEGSQEAIYYTQTSSARYFQRPDNDHTELDSSRTSLAGSGGRMQVMKLNGHWNFMLASIWKTPGFETNDIGFLRESDQILNVLWAGYNVWDPKGIYLRYNINFDVFQVTNFGAENLGKGFEWNGSMQFKNYWNVFTGGNLVSSGVQTGLLRGGPSMEMPGNINLRLGFSTDNRKKVNLEVFGRVSKGFENSSENLYTQIELSYKPTNWLVLSFVPGISKSFSEMQYVTHKTPQNQHRYIFASIDRQTVNTSFRINLNLSPDLTLQYWGQPFVATGRYYDHTLILDNKAQNYKDRFWTYSESQKETDGSNYAIDENLDGKTDYSFKNSDFNVREFLSNLVVRWEYSPGSSVYLVWSQTRSSYENTGELNYSDDIIDLFSTADNHPHNVFLVKFSYRFGLK
ncbi:MAG: carbohydrate binding family 9 domain-containing protein [Bacteroidales bacterium]|nr:carbohydrate binding family 9 domain-containing protein [Bacteroidales bacterium]